MVNQNLFVCQTWLKVGSHELQMMFVMIWSFSRELHGVTSQIFPSASLSGRPNYTDRDTLSVTLRERRRKVWPFTPVRYSVFRVRSVTPPVPSPPPSLSAPDTTVRVIPLKLKWIITIITLNQYVFHMSAVPFPGITPSIVEIYLTCAAFKLSKVPKQKLFVRSFYNCPSIFFYLFPSSHRYDTV